VRINLRKTLFILPNLFTLSSIFCGFSAILACASNPTEADFRRASLLIIFAMFFDVIDGRVARLTRTQSAFGVQIDSLADVVSFGVAPGLLVYKWALSPLGMFGVFTSFLMVACGAIRLARFNVLATATDGRPTKPSKYILGLPIPGAAGILVSVVVAARAIPGDLRARPGLIAAIVFALAFFMVSTIKFRSFKDVRLSWRTVSFVALAVGIGATIALKFDFSVALVWLLASYVVIAVVESMITISRRIRRRGLPPEEEHVAGH
jgi:CDP-diacylglycerol--serine O-phosphatidyltransferase